jgi:RHS repeat-associated protein
MKYGASSSSSSSSSGGPGNALVHLLYGYDQASNRTYREDLVAQAYDKDFDELYEYDGMQRLKKFHRGRLSEDKQAIIDPALQQGWHLDATGNWQNFTQNDQEDASQTLDQQRIANQVNEITQIARTVGPNWATPAYDRNGNMIVIPQPKDMTQTFQGTWDAWNRLVKLKELDGIGGWQNLAEYQYDGQTWRIVTKNYDSGMLDETRHFYFTRGWQDIEERLGTTPSTADAQQQYVWGLRYIDELIRRNRDSDTVYVLQSIDWSVETAIDIHNAVLCRFAYDPYGSRVTLHFSSHQPLAGIDYGLHGVYLDAKTSIYLARHRYFSPPVGCWLSRDNLAYVDGSNLYRLYQIPGGLDPLGTKVNGLIYFQATQSQESLYELSVVGQWYPEEDNDCDCKKVAWYQIAKSRLREGIIPLPFDDPLKSNWHFDPIHRLPSGYVVYERLVNVYAQFRDDPSVSTSWYWYSNQRSQSFESCAVCIDPESSRLNEVFGCVKWGHYISGKLKTIHARASGVHKILSVSNSNFSGNVIVYENESPSGVEENRVDVIINKTSGQAPSREFIINVQNGINLQNIHDVTGRPAPLRW